MGDSASLRRLIIGYGNLLCGDDAVGRILAEQVVEWACPDVRTISTHQLTPDYALDIANADRVLFVDAILATTSEDECRIKPLRTKANGAIMSHQVEPPVLLALAQSLYDACPESWLLTIPGIAFEIGDSLSPIGKRNSDKALNLIRHWLLANAR